MSGPADNREARARAAAELRGIANGSIPVEGEAPPLDADGLLVDDDEVRDLLMFAKRAYRRQSDPDDPPFEETEWFQRRITRYATDDAARAVREGDLSTMDHMIGRPDYKNDVSGLHTVSRVERWLCERESTVLAYIASLMGRGKTDFALSLLQVVWHHYRRLRESAREIDAFNPADVPEPDLAANFKVETPDHIDAEVKEINSFSELSEWAEKGSSDDVRWFIFDEASTELTAQSGANAQDVAEVMAPFVKKMRKNGINMIVIGHDKGDVHPAIREIADFVSKPEKKKARVYEGVNNREPVGHLFSLDRVPPTGWEFDTDDLAEWSWDGATDDLDGVDALDSDEFREWRNERIQTLYGDYELSQKDVAEVMGLGKTTVNRVVNATA